MTQKGNRFVGTVAPNVHTGKAQWIKVLWLVRAKGARGHSATSSWGERENATRIVSHTLRSTACPKTGPNIEPLLESDDCYCTTVLLYYCTLRTGLLFSAMVFKSSIPLLTAVLKRALLDCFEVKAAAEPTNKTKEAANFMVTRGQVFLKK